MITSGRRAKRPDGPIYRTMRRQGVSKRTVLETISNPARQRPRRGPRLWLQRAAVPLRFLWRWWG